MSVRFGILALLEQGPSHGYQLKADFESRTGGVWTVNVGQVYSTLDRLHGEGLVAPVEDDGDGGERRPWRLTPAGKEAIDAWFDEVSVAATPPRDELLVKVLLALSRSPGAALAVIDVQRAALYALLREQRRGPSGGDDPAVVLMAEAVAARHEADLRWLDRCEEMARTLTTTPREGTA